MGNHQSAESPRRLTKPRTNTSTTNLLAAASVSRRGSTLEPVIAANKIASRISLADVLDSAVVLDAPEKGKAVDRPKRRSLFRSKSTAESRVEKSDPVEEARDTDTSHPLQRYSSISSLMVDMPEESHNRHGSSHHPRNHRSTTIQHPRSQSVARLSLVVEVQTPEPGLQHESKQLGFKATQPDDVSYEDPTSTPTEQSSSNRSAPAMGIPIRRRSLLTPGIATRSSSNDNMYRSSLNPQPFLTLTSAEPTQRQRRSLPSQNSLSFDHLQQRYSHESSTTPPPLDRIAALQTPSGFDSQPRVSTPSDLDYRHTGAFKLGTLRITNGSASPVPSVQERIFWDSSPKKTNGGGSQHPQYESPSRKRESRLGRADGEGQYASSNLMDSSPSPRHPTSEPPNIMQTTVEIPSFSLAYDFESHVNSSRQLELETPKSSQEIAQAYMQDIASSPFSFEETPSPSPQLEATSKHTAIEDNLFDDESDYLFLHSPSTAEHVSRQSSTSTCDQPSAEQLRLAKGAVKNLQPNHIRTVPGPQEPAPKPLEKADSGYSSKTSLRSFGSRMSNMEKETTREEQMAPAVPSRGLPAPPMPSKSPPPPPQKTVYVRNSFGVNIASRAAQGVQSPDADGFSKDALIRLDAPATYPRVEYSGYYASHDSSMTPHQPQMHSLNGLRLNPYQGNFSTPQRRPLPPKTRQSEPPPLPVKSIEENQAAARIPPNGPEALKKPTTIRRQSTPNPIHASSNSLISKPSESDMSITSTKRKLQKQRQAMEPEVVVQGHSEIDTGTIPPVSQDAANHLEERLKNFPTLSHTYKSVHKTNSKETLATVLSAGSPEVRAEDRMPWSRLGGHQLKLSTTSSNEDIEQFVSEELFHQTLTQAKTAPGAPKLTKGRRKSAGSLTRSHDPPRNPSTVEVDGRKFDVGSESLDSSPFDFTVMNHANSASYGSHSSWSSDHGESVKAVGGRTVGMDSHSAAQLARERSRILRRHSCEKWASSTDQHWASTITQLQNSTVEDGPPMPNLPSQGHREKPRMQKMKSSPPVSMKLQSTQLTGLQPPSRSAPTLPLDVRQHSVSNSEWSENPIPDGNQWQHRISHWHEDRRDLKLPQKPAERGHFPPSMSSDDSCRPSAQQCQATSERQSRPTSQPLLAKPFRNKLPPSSHQNPSFQNQRNAIARQLFDPLPPRQEGGPRDRSFVGSIAGPRWDSSQRPGQSMTEDFPPSEPIMVGRYHGGYGYGFERGLGVGGSAGLRNEVTAASRKGVEGSLLWGVDFSDVPIIVMQRPGGLEV